MLHDQSLSPIIHNLLHLLSHVFGRFGYGFLYELDVAFDGHEDMAEVFLPGADGLGEEGLTVEVEEVEDFNYLVRTSRRCERVVGRE